MTTKIRIELEQAFKAECKVIDLKHEYTGYRENIRCAIATALTENGPQIEVQRDHCTV